MTIAIHLALLALSVLCMWQLQALEKPLDEDDTDEEDGDG